MAAEPPRLTGSKPLGRAIWSWALFQGGRDPYIILMTIYIFVPYLVRSVIGDPVRGQSLVATGAMVAGWATALTAPLLGASVDRMGPRKPWLTGIVALMLPLLVTLWWAKPAGGLSAVTVVAILAVISVLYAYSETLHNALLMPAAGARAGAASGLGLALGNFVSVTLLVLVLWAFVLPGSIAGALIPRAPLLGLDPRTHEPERIVPLLVAVVLALGTIPMLRFVPDVPATGTRVVAAARLSIGDLLALVRAGRGHRDPLVYLGARMLFTDGLTGILVFTGVFAAGVMGWQTLQLLAYGIILCVFAVGGGLLAGVLDQRIGPKRALTIEIIGVIASQIMSLGNTPVTLFYAAFTPSAHARAWSGPLFNTWPEIGLIASSIIGAITVTAAYASSRTMLTRVAPADKIGVFFGLFVIAGAATSWLGPLLVDIATRTSGSQRVGLLPLSILLLAGLGVLQLVGERNPGRVSP